MSSTTNDNGGGFVNTSTSGDFNTSTTTSAPHIRLLTQLFLQTVTCQVITGFFAWAALLITVQHVMFSIFSSCHISFSWKTFNY